MILKGFPLLVINSEENNHRQIKSILPSFDCTLSVAVVGRNFTFVKEKNNFFEWLVWRIPFSNMNLTKLM